MEEETVRISADIPKKTYLLFKKKITEKYGGIKGDFRKALSEAIEQWIQNN